MSPAQRVELWVLSGETEELWNKRDWEVGSGLTSPSFFFLERGVRVALLEG